MAHILFEIKVKKLSGELNLKLPPQANKIKYAMALLEIEDELIKQLVRVKLKLKRSDRLIDILT